jgi:hypothetical protein
VSGSVAPVGAQLQERVGSSVSSRPDPGSTDRTVPTAVGTAHHIGFKYFSFLSYFLKFIKNYRKF